MIFKKMMVAVIGLVLVFCNIAYAADTWSLVGGNVNSDRVYEIQTVTDSNGTPYVAFHDNNFSNKITVKKYDGSSWVTVGIPGFTSQRPDFYKLAIDSNDNIYILHSHQNYDPMPGSFDQPYKISVTRFNGISWEIVGAVEFANGTRYTSIAFDSNDVPYVAYSDKDNDVKGTIKKYDGSSWVNVGSTFTNAYCNTQLISLEIDSNN
ncbi:MAG: hypothetical protein MJA31_13510, partial [Clostridia bacterium]|nr:hypothetical protein [Clostridia bacterium]